MRAVHRSIRLLFLATLLSATCIFVLLPRTVWAAPTHALPLSYVPAINAVLAASPTEVRITFSEHLNASTSRIVVVDPSNRELDNRDSHVLDDGNTMVVSVPLLQAGTYVVFWRSTSADDGHTTGSTYLFHIKNADGKVPPLTGPLPSGNAIGQGLSSGGVDLPTVIASLARAVGLLALAIILGGIFWRVIVLPRTSAFSDTTQTRFASLSDRVTILAFAVMIGAAVIEILAQAVQLDGTLRGIFSLSLLNDILFRSRFGLFVIVRVALSLVALFWLYSPEMRRHTNRLLEPLFAIVLMIAFVYSGHGAATNAAWGSIVDFIHLGAYGIWLGGIFYLVAVILPVVAREGTSSLARYLGQNVPAFAVPALVSAAILAITGPLNANARMTSFSQLWTTGYGIILSLKVAIFIVMAAVAYQHAFPLRARLATLVANDKKKAALLTQHGTTTPEAEVTGRWQLEDVTRAILGRMRIEASLGLGIILCVGLLSAFAGTLTPTLAATTSSFGATGGPVSQTQAIDGYSVTVKLAPGTFGTNTFTVAVKNADGTPMTGGGVYFLTSMVEMDMGENEIDLAENPAVHGEYTGQGELPMAGHWHLKTFVRAPSDPKTNHITTFTVGVGQ